MPPPKGHQGPYASNPRASLVGVPAGEGHLGEGLLVLGVGHRLQLPVLQLRANQTMCAQEVQQTPGLLQVGVVELEAGLAVGGGDLGGTHEGAATSVQMADSTDAARGEKGGEGDVGQLPDEAPQLELLESRRRRVQVGLGVECRLGGVVPATEGQPGLAHGEGDVVKDQHLVGHGGVRRREGEVDDVPIDDGVEAVADGTGAPVGLSDGSSRLTIAPPQVAHAGGGEDAACRRARWLDTLTAGVKGQVRQED